MTDAQRSAWLLGILAVNPRQALAAREHESLFWRGQITLSPHRDPEPTPHG